MHPTADTNTFKFQQSCGAARDAWRYAVTTRVREDYKAMIHTSEQFSGEYDFVAVCLAAIERRDYKAALASLKKGLGRNIEEGRPAGGEFLRHMRTVVVALEASLRNAYGHDWGRDIVAPVSSADHGRPRCSFCGKLEGAVEKIITGPDVGICDECVGICLEILRDDGLSGSGGGTA